MQFKNQQSKIFKAYFTFSLLLVFSFAACVNPNTHSSNSQEKKGLSVTASIYPLAFLAEALTQDRGTVQLLVPPGGEPHDFDPTPGQIVSVLNSDLVLTVGTGIEPWLADLRPELVKKQIALLVMNESLEDQLLEASGDAHHEEAIEEEHEEESSKDPHTWLDPLLMIQMTQQLLTALSSLDPEGRELYEARAEHLMAQLKKLHETTAKALLNCEKDTILVSHNAFAYLAQRYGFKTLSATGVSPNLEPSAQELANLSQEAQRLGLKIMFMETLATPEIAEVLAKEAKLTSLPLNPLEGLTQTEKNEGKNYLSISEENRDNLAIGLQCEQQLQ
jgi:zinc transport system substrate-binding protein